MATPMFVAVSCIFLSAKITKGPSTTSLSMNVSSASWVSYISGVFSGFDLVIGIEFITYSI